MENNSFIGSIPWAVAAATAAWLGVMAYKAGKNTVLSAVGGGLLGLVVTTIILGLGQATFIPFCPEEVAPSRIKLAVFAIVIVACIGWLFTGSLHRRLLAALKLPSPLPAPPIPPAKPPPSGPKQ